MEGIEWGRLEEVKSGDFIYRCSHISVSLSVLTYRTVVSRIIKSGDEADIVLAS